MAVYDAFISYSHAQDKSIAAALQSAVQKLGKPWYRRRALRVFRDDQPLGHAATVALDRAGAWEIALLRPAGLSGGCSLKAGSIRRWPIGSITIRSTRC